MAVHPQGCDRLSGFARARSAPAVRHGAQLLAAVLLAYAAARALHLPGGWWAVMSALVVVRPGSAATRDAGWDRVRGALLGAGVALLGVGLCTLGLDAAIATLAVVAGLAFWSATAPGMRSAPITALIVMQASTLAGQAAWTVALARILEIGVGIGAGALVTWPFPVRRAAARFDAACAAQLRQWAAALPQLLGGQAGDRAAESLVTRAALFRLGLLAGAADRGVPWRASGSAVHAQAARLLTRTCHDLSVLARLLGLLPQDAQDRCAAALAQVVGRALQGSADDWCDRGTPDLAALRRWARSCLDNAEDPEVEPGSLRWLAPATALLAQDLTALARLRQTRSSGSCRHG